LPVVPLCVAFEQPEPVPDERFNLGRNGRTNLDKASSVNVHLSVSNVRYRESEYGKAVYRG